MSDELENAQQSNPVEQAPVKSAKKKFYQKKWGKILIGFVVVTIVLFVVVMKATSGAVKASNEFLNAIQSGNSSQAYSLFASEVKGEVSSDDFKEVVSQIGPILNTDEKITNRGVEAESGKNSTANVEYEIKGTDGKTYTIAVNLVKEDGEWKVLNFDSDEDN